MGVIECIANISEGQRHDVVAAVADAVRAVPGVRLLDVHSDSSHHRSVLTFAGEYEPLAAAVLALFAQAIEKIDLRAHRGEHPRIGAVDVVPFVPLEGATMADCVALAREVGAEVAARHRLPVYLYEEAATDPDRRHLEDIRRGGFEALAEKMARPGWLPDFGPSTPHSAAGATAIGARGPLIAYNVNLATDRLDVARQIAATIRASSGGFPFVKAMGIRLGDRNIVQVSMNLTNFGETPIYRVFEAVAREAARHAVAVLESEIVGLVPATALTDTAAHYLKLDPARTARQVLETRLASEQ